MATHCLPYSCPVLWAGGATPLVGVAVQPARGMVVITGCLGLLAVDDVLQVVGAA